jgi:hypothetical protein
MCQKENQLQLWERISDIFRSEAPRKETYPDHLLALGQTIKWSRLDYDHQRYQKYLLEIITLAQTQQDSLQVLHWKSILGNFLLQKGHIEEAQPLLQEAVHQAIILKQRLLLISQGTLLCSLWLSQGEFEKVSSLCLQIDQAALVRNNWIALASSRNMRASCWLIRRSRQQAVSLLLDTGDLLAKKGAIAALNLIKARLGELQLLLGKQQLLSLVQQRNVRLNKS